MDISIRIVVLIFSLSIFYISYISSQVNGLANDNQINICKNDRFNINLTTDKKIYLKNESITLTVTNFDNKIIPFPDPVLGMKIKNINNNLTKGFPAPSVLFGLQPLKPWSFNLTSANFPLINTAGNYTIIIFPFGKTLNYNNCFTIQ